MANETTSGTTPAPGEQAQASSGVPPTEPILELDDIQGNTIPGLNKPCQAILFLEVGDDREAKRWLGRQADRLTSARHVLDFRAARRLALQSFGLSVPIVAKAWMNLGFTSAGLRKLGVDVTGFSDRAFRAGMGARAKLLGDPSDPSDGGAVANWVVGSPGKIPDLIVVLAHDTPCGLAVDVDRVIAGLPPGLRVMHQEDGMRRSAPRQAWEHFGFRDGISQPGIRGMISDRPGDYLTPRLNPNDPNQGLPGQDLVWPGEFVFGYPTQPIRPGDPLGPLSTAGPSWSRNGSYLVFRRLVQDVAGFRGFLEQSSTRLRARFAEFADLDADVLAARMIGRWSSGAPLSRVPLQDVSGLGADDLGSNNFQYEQSTPALEIGSSDRGGHRYPSVPADRDGSRCPFASHIRKSNPRDGGSEGAIKHRILRRGIPFGPPYPDPTEKGMLFLCYQASIERQFEFITTQWLVQTNEPIAGAGLDALLGQPGRVALVTLPTRDGDLKRIAVPISPRFVRPTGGDYFFVPSIDALRLLSP